MNRSMKKSLSQTQAPLFEAMQTHIQEEVVPFHVPAHKHGKGLSEMQDFFGRNTLLSDLNSMSDLDDLNNPVSVIDEAQQLAAEAFNAKYAHFLINGTTSGIHAMFLSVLNPGDRIILPRNSHKSAFSALILSGAVPTYAHVQINEKLGIATMPSYKEIERCFMRSPQTMALFLLNPNYYGFVSDLKSLFSLAREWDSYILVDEAHGGHFNFHSGFPQTAMEAGADMSAISMHKTCGSLTQSALLLINEVQGDYRKIDNLRVLNTLNLINSTSASYLLMISLDIARRQLIQKGEHLLAQSIELAQYAREKINEIDGLHAFSRELIDEEHVFDFDDTKLCIYVQNLGMTGFEMECRLRQEYSIQIELSDLNNIMAIITIGDTKNSISKLIFALSSIAKKCKIRNTVKFSHIPDIPELIVIPRDAFYAHKKSVLLENSLNEISGEMLMSYPPGIPVVCPGERITQDMIDYITILKENNSTLQGTADPLVEYIRVLGF